MDCACAVVYFTDSPSSFSVCILSGFARFRIKGVRISEVLYLNQIIRGLTSEDSTSEAQLAKAQLYSEAQVQNTKLRTLNSEAQFQNTKLRTQLLIDLQGHAPYPLLVAI